MYSSAMEDCWHTQQNPTKRKHLDEPHCKTDQIRATQPNGKYLGKPRKYHPGQNNCESHRDSTRIET